ncbi:hypothetical protein [Caballeronia telluris]|uniref:Replication protein n=1 Tax=Caballeronia telluris TaxID=326475 RepID=A0A158G1Q6_9BURK|nr:hypothetical protein [Caballeronia telluris]SAL26005.1 hypothetical protein AWB66_01503 [Caballeronia telluris]
MRDYSKVSPQFWIGETGKRLRKAGAEAQVVGLYLMTSPHANMLGLYYVPMLYIAHETGLGMEGASKGLQSCIEAGFCQYDEASEMVWVMEMASYQIASSLVATDKRCAGVQNEYNALPENPYLAAFFDKFRSVFHMSKCRPEAAGKPSLIEAPSKPLASQEQEQEQEQEKTSPDGEVAIGDADSASGDKLPNCPQQKLIDLYAQHLPTLPFPRVWEGERQKAMRTRWRWALTATKRDGSRYATDEETALAFFDRFFRFVSESDFLTGRSGKWTSCDLGWLMKAENFAKVIQGNYENKEAA